MDKVVSILKHEFMTNFKRTEYKFLTFLIPGLFLLAGASTLLIDQTQTAAILSTFSSQNIFFTIPMSFAMIFGLTILTSSGFLLNGMAKEKENRLMEVMLTSISFKKILLGKIIGLGLLGLVQVTAWLASIAIVFLLFIPPTIGTGINLPGLGTLAFFAAIYFFTGYLFFASLLAGIGALANDLRQAQQIGSLITVFALLPAWSSIMLVSASNSLAAKAMSYFPVTAPVTMIIRIFLGGVETGEIAISIVSLLVSTIAVILVSGYLFKSDSLIKDIEKQMQKAGNKAE